MNVAIIPARGGSKRIPGKNIKPFMGKPIICYSISAAKSSGLFKRIIVSTDSERIAEVAWKEGAEVPFMRPPDLADDRTPLTDVVRHALNWLKQDGALPTYACSIFSTAPFIRESDIRKGFDLLRQRGVTAVIPVASYGFPIFRAMKIVAEGRLEMIWPEHEFSHSNNLPEAYHDAGQFYWLNVEKFLKEKSIYSSDALPLVLPRHMVQDIDKSEDWERAELMFKAYVDLSK